MKPGDEVCLPTGERGARVTHMQKYGRGDKAYERVTVAVDGELHCYLRSELIPVLVPRKSVLGMIGRMA